MRNVKIATVSFGVEETPVTRKDNIAKARTCVHVARQENCDIILFPEWFLSFNTEELTNVMKGTDAGGMFKNISEKITGTSVKEISSIARDHSIHVVGSFLLHDDAGKVSNTALLFDRKGKIAGRYDKYQVNPLEKRKGINPGKKLPVFKLDFGTVALMVCNDIYFPEIARLYAAKGAEIVFWMTMACGPTEHNLETQFKARAMDNSVHLAVSNFSYDPPYAPYAGRCLLGRACIVNHDGNIIADTGHQPGIAVATIDLDKKRLGWEITEADYTDVMKEDILKQVRFNDYAAEYVNVSRSRRS